MAFNFKFLRKAKSADSPPEVAPIAVPRRALPLIGNLSFEIQFRLLGAIFLVSLLVTLTAVYLQGQANARGAAYLSVSGEIRPLAQQIPKAAQNAIEGQRNGFRELRQARARFGLLVEHLSEGGESGGVAIPASTRE